MGTLLQMNPSQRRSQAAQRLPHSVCEIVIFPGVRIERHAPDAGSFQDASQRRARETEPQGRPRKTS